ncbi:hypothetical protein LguiB_023389 [Lonicera macranthoides]
MAFLNQKSVWLLILTLVHHNNAATMEEYMKQDDDVNDDDDYQQLEYCAVCLGQVCCGDKYRILSKCNHGFHVDCIDAWLQDHSTCPLCRTTLVLPLLHNNLAAIQFPRHNNYRLFLSYLLYPFQAIWKWMQKPLSDELFSSISQNSFYLS